MDASSRLFYFIIALGAILGFCEAGLFGLIAAPFFTYKILTT